MKKLLMSILQHEDIKFFFANTMQQIFCDLFNLIFQKENDELWPWKEIIPTSIFVALMLGALWMSIKG